MTKKTYTEEEVEEITKDLESKLAKLIKDKQTDGKDAEIQKLKRLILTFKKKYQRALQELANKENTQPVVATDLANDHIEAQAENKALIVQQQFLKEHLQRAQEELEHLRNQSTHAPASQKQTDTDSANVSEKNDVLSQRIESLVGENQRLEKNLEEKIQQKNKVENEMETMKQTLVQGLRETREIKRHYQMVTNEKAATIQKNIQLQQQVGELKNELERREKEQDIVIKNMEMAQGECQEVEKNLQQEKDSQIVLKREIKEKEENIASLSGQIITMQSKVKDFQDLASQKDADILEAQQHLAKKVKENSLHRDTHEGQQHQIEKLQEDLINAKANVAEAQKSVESQLEQQKKLQEQLAAWEEKYFRVYEKWQNAEAQNKALKKVEEKHEQMQHLLSNLGNVLGSPIGLTQPYGMLQDGQKPPVPPVDMPRAKQKPKTSQGNRKNKPKEPPKQKDPSSENTLFDPNKPPSKYKKDLFD